ncbi:MAG TPA: class I SAM-dependent methyltransferase [Casimicrobiaceae bacterium]|nr:class I SAM-dependent methyltransferase [Casimicrobiaceae bacterium]
MPQRIRDFDADSVRKAWDAAADAYAEGQASGRDYYRFEFFGPAHLALCAVAQGLRVLDVGCGTGYFAREMARRGAIVTGADLSPAMLAHARELEAKAPLGIRYVDCDAARLRERLPAESFDLATSCLALQDMPDIPAVLRAIHDLLVPGGRLVASIAHPCTDTPFRVWAKDDAGEKQWLCIDRYFDRGPLEYTWQGWLYEFRTPAYHATLEDWFGWILRAGFSVRGLHEPAPTAAAVAARPELADAARVPYYLLLDLAKPEPTSA